jgi:hypothetical protein
VNATASNQNLTASHQLADSGFEILEGVLSGTECETLADQLSRLHERQREQGGNKLGGLRNLIRLDQSVAKLASSGRIKSVLKERVFRDVFPVRALFFDKTPGANWSVAWHQDLSIAVTEKIETPGFSGWSVKEGVTHVQPTSAILEGMVTMR